MPAGGYHYRAREGSCHWHREEESCQDLAHLLDSGNGPCNASHGQQKEAGNRAAVRQSDLKMKCTQQAKNAALDGSTEKLELRCSEREVGAVAAQKPESRLHALRHSPR